MGFRQGAFASIWHVNDGEKVTTANITVSKKNWQDESKYDVVFADGFVRFVGTAREKLKECTRNWANGKVYVKYGKERDENGNYIWALVPPDGQKKMTIKILSCDVENRYGTSDSNPEGKKLYTNYTVFDFECPDDSGNTKSSSNTGKSSAKTSKPAPAAAEADEDELPF